MIISTFSQNDQQLVETIHALSPKHADIKPPLFFGLGQIPSIAYKESIFKFSEHLI